MPFPCVPSVSRMRVVTFMPDPNNWASRTRTTPLFLIQRALREPRQPRRGGAGDNGGRRGAPFETSGRECRSSSVYMESSDSSEYVLSSEGRLRYEDLTGTSRYWRSVSILESVIFGVKGTEVGIAGSVLSGPSSKLSSSSALWASTSFWESIVLGRIHLGRADSSISGLVRSAQLQKDNCCESLGVHS